MGTVSNSYEGWKYDWGRGGYDRLNNLSFNFIYSLPFMRNSSNAVLKTLVGGWEVSGIVTIESGTPLNITLSGGQGGNGVGGTNRPDKAGSIVDTAHETAVGYWLGISLPRQSALGVTSLTTVSMALGVITGTCRCSRTSCSAKLVAANSNCGWKPLTPLTIHRSRA